MKDFLKIFSCCNLVRGANRVSVYDSQRSEIYFLPLSILSLIDFKFMTIDINYYRQSLESESLIVFEEYILFLLENEIAFICKEEEIENFPEINAEYLFPSHISNIVIDSCGHEINFIDDFFLRQLEMLCCNYIQLRFFGEITMKELQLILDRLNPTQLKAIEIILPWQQCWSEENALPFIKANRKVRNLNITNALVTKIVQKEDYLDGALVYSEQKVDKSIYCGVVQLEQFSVNSLHFAESQQHNTCLNRKIAIDIEGNIKNCPSMVKSYGNIKDTSLIDVVNNPEFQKVWHIKKDEIAKCKDCEFRHICTDCRAYVENPEDQYSAPLKCGYNPYTCEWEEWSTNPLKQKAIEYYGMQELEKE